MKTLSGRRLGFASLLLAMIVVADGGFAADKAPSQDPPPASGKRFYRGSWRDFAKEAAALEKKAAAAQQANDEHAAFDAFHDLAFVESDRERFVAMLRAAEACVQIGERWFATGRRPESVTYRERIYHLECRGLMEKGFAYQGRLAEGQAQIRRLRKELEALHVSEHGGSAASLRTLTELDRWHERSLFLLWGLIEREALYVAWAGGGNDAVPTLRAAVEAARRSRTGERIDSFYEIQFAQKLAARLNDLGYQREAVTVLEEFVREWDGQRARFAEQYWRARVLLAMFRTELEGPSESLLRAAEEAREQYLKAVGSGRDHWSAGVVTFIRHQLRPSLESEAELRRVSAQMRKDDEVLQSLSTSFDALVVANNFAKPGLDQEYIGLLEAVRRVGKKSLEPPIYKSYGDYLLKLGHPADALPIYREALRQVEDFGWRVQVPRYRLAIIAALVRLGNFAAAEVEWAVLDRVVAATVDLPPERALEVRLARINWLLRRTLVAEARAALAEARSFATVQNLNAWQRRDLEALDLGAPQLTANSKKVAPVPVSLQPARIETEAAPGDPLRARFALRNPASTACAGTLIARGPAARLSFAENPHRIVGAGTTGGAMMEARLAVTLPAGEELPVALETAGDALKVGAEIGWRLAWHEGATAPLQRSEWRIRSDDEPFVTSVLNAQQLRRNPFYSISFTHQIVHRDASAARENIRFIASEPLRLECYDASTGRLLAIDAEGNGEFNDPGDVLLEDADANGALDLAFPARERLREIEVFVFPLAGRAASGKTTVTVELLTAAGWEKGARNELETE